MLSTPFPSSTRKLGQGLSTCRKFDDPDIKVYGITRAEHEDAFRRVNPTGRIPSAKIVRCEATGAQKGSLINVLASHGEAVDDLEFELGERSEVGLFCLTLVHDGPFSPNCTLVT